MHHLPDLHDLDANALAAEATAKGVPTGLRKGRLRGLQKAESDERFLKPAEAGFADALARPLGAASAASQFGDAASFALPVYFVSSRCLLRSLLKPSG